MNIFGVGKTGVGEIGQIIGETGVGKMGVGETGTSRTPVMPIANICSTGYPHDCLPDIRG